ncbi:MAG: LuxR family transcriptional regulator [Bacteroidales bacterium]|nr:LuxR family transcriptional regulator [Bacteroidales bacterium]
MRVHEKVGSNILKIILLFILFASCTCNSDSNSKIISEKDSLSQKADSLYYLGRSYSENSLNQERALELYEQSFELYKKSGNKARMATLYKRMGFAYDYLEDFSKVKEYQKKAFKINTEIDNKIESAIILNFLGIAYTITGDIDSALIFYAQGLELSEITGDTAEIIDIYQNMGISYRDAGNYEKAIDSYIKALEFCEIRKYITGIYDLNLNIAHLFKESDDLDMAFSYCNKASEYINAIENPRKQTSFYQTCGELHYEKANYKKAGEYFRKTLKISRKANFKRGMAAAYSTLALIALKEQNYEKAEKYAYLSINLENEIDNMRGVISSLITIAETQYYQRKYDKAIVQLQKAEDLCNKKSIYEQLPNIYYHFYQVYKLAGKQKSALQYCENYYILKDSLTGVKVKEKIADLEIKHQTEKKQQEIELLNEENNTKRLKITARNHLIISLVLLVIVIIGIAYFFRQRAKQRLNRMESDIQKYILQIKDLNSIQKNEPEIKSKEFSIKYELTERETEILHLISEGMTNPDIGKKIFVSTNTVKYHLKNIYIKLDVKNRVEALYRLKQ